jgi:aspartate beta-hydroxylase
MSSAASNDSGVLLRALIKTGELDDALSRAHDMLEVDPAQLEALAFVIQQAAAREDFQDIIGVVENAIAAGVRDAELYRVLAQARINSGDTQGAQTALESSLALAPEQFHLWLTLGHLREAAGQAQQALIAYLRAVTAAQKQGRWLSDETTNPAMRDRVRHAIAFAAQGRSRLFSDSIAAVRRRHGAAATARVERCIAGYLGDEALVYNSPAQRPTFLYFPGLPAAGFYPRDLFPWMDEVEASTEAIRNEALAVLAEGNALEPFLGPASDMAPGQLRNDKGKPVWDAFFFYRHGKRYDEHCERCPVTAGLLDRVPLARIDGHAPESLFSVLTPGSHILPHTGVTNTRLVAHLPLIVPPDCAIRVGEEQRAWEEGKGFVFDDTYEHEAWNFSERTRTVLIMDVWNPYLTDAEREALRDLVVAIGELNRACGIGVVQ